MEYSVQTQTFQFLLSGLFGISLGLHYDLLRAIRHTHRRLTALLDGWFWLCALIGALALALYGAGGRFHIFMFLGTSLGMAAYFWGPGILIRKILDKVFGAIHHFCVLLTGTLKIFLKKAFSKGKKSVRMLCDRVKPKIRRRSKKGGKANADQVQKNLLHHEAGDHDPAGLCHGDPRLSSAAAFGKAAPAGGVGGADHPGAAGQCRAAGGHRRPGHRRRHRGRGKGKAGAGIRR
ncbi:MAG: hypothetical protein E7464_05315 [Ruminococcaceae bacterium]|nr:hypothetical protein [Oscillospiraceae bacterium]